MRVGGMEPIRRINLTSQVMESVKSYIIENDLQAGDRLPTEKELMAMLGVSRNILREALKSIEAVGLIEIRVGDGTYVADFDYANVMSAVSFAISRTKQEMKHFVESRLIIEVGAIEGIVSNVQDSDIEELDKLLKGYDGAKSVSEAANWDMKFHEKLLSISYNPILCEFGSFLAKFFMEAQHFVTLEKKPDTATSHRDLLMAIKEKNKKLARQILRKHILTWDVELG